MNEGQKKKEMWLYIQIGILFIVVDATLIIWSSYDWVTVPGSHVHMLPSFEEYSYSIGNSVSAGRYEEDSDELNYEDVVYYDFEGNRTQEEEDALFFSRIVGLPGDKIAFEKGQLIRNGSPIDEVYISPENKGQETFPEIIIPNNHVYIINDNRKLVGKEAFYRDSRYAGPISMFVIKGLLQK